MKEKDLGRLRDARKRGEEGANRAADASGEEWVEYARAFLYKYLTSHQYMHVDDLWDAGLDTPVSPRGLGQIMMYAARKGWMRQMTHMGCVLAQSSVRSNGQLKAVWESLLYKRENGELVMPKIPELDPDLVARLHRDAEGVMNCSNERAATELEALAEIMVHWINDSHLDEDRGEAMRRIMTRELTLYVARLYKDRK